MRSESVQGLVKGQADNEQAVPKESFFILPSLLPVPFPIHINLSFTTILYYADGPFPHKLFQIMTLSHSSNSIVSQTWLSRDSDRGNHLTEKNLRLTLIQMNVANVIVLNCCTIYQQDSQ